MSTLDTGTSEPDADAEFTTADFAMLASQGNWDAKPAQASAHAAARAQTNPASAADRTRSVDDDETDGWNSNSATPRKISLTKGERNKPARVAQETGEKKRVLFTAAVWTPGDYVAVKPADLGELFTQHQQRCQAIDAGLGRFLYHCYAGVAAAIGVALNVVSYLTAKLSALLVNPRNTGAPGSLAETVAVHIQRAHNSRFVVGKVLYSGWAGVSTPVTVVLNALSWLTAQAAVAVNDPRRLGRVLLALLFAAITMAGIAMVVG